MIGVTLNSAGWRRLADEAHNCTFPYIDLVEAGAWLQQHRKEVVAALRARADRAEVDAVIAPPKRLRDSVASLARRHPKGSRTK